MSLPQTLTDDQAAAIWSGDTASILNLEPTTTETQTDEDKDKTPETNATAEKTPGLMPSDEELNNVWAEGKDDEEEDEEEDKTPATPAKTTEAEPARKGRKPAELVSLVNQLVEEEVLFGYEDGEIKTVDEAKALIVENLKHREANAGEDAWKKKIEAYSPQVQAIIHYAEQGGKDISSLMSAIAQAEDTSDLTLDTDAGQEEIVRQNLKIKGFDDEEIKDQIEILKDTNKLKARAEKYLPELTKMQEKRVEMMLQEQEDRRRQAEEASRVYLQTIQETLDKEEVGDVKLSRAEKAQIFEALAVAKHRSLNGVQVNGFIKSLEDMQFGKNADYGHFANIVLYATQKEKFIEKLTEKIKAELTSDTIKKLKTAKATSANAQEEPAHQPPQKKNVISREKFRNPYS